MGHWPGCRRLGGHGWTRQLEPGLKGVTVKRVRFLDHPVQIAQDLFIESEIPAEPAPGMRLMPVKLGAFQTFGRGWGFQYLIAQPKNLGGRALITGTRPGMGKRRPIAALQNFRTEIVDPVRRRHPMMKGFYFLEEAAERVCTALAISRPNFSTARLWAATRAW